MVCGLNVELLNIESAVTSIVRWAFKNLSPRSNKREGILSKRQIIRGRVD
jgi:hypothetical protein